MKNILILMLLLSYCIFSTQNAYNSNLADSIFINEDAVILNDETVFTITDSESADLIYSKSILIKNRNAENYCKVYTSGSSFIEIEDIEAAIFDTLGNMIKELDTDDIKEEELSISSFYSGHVYNYFKLTHHSYPYILKYKIEKKYKTLFFWPSWYPQDDIPTLKSTYKIINEERVKFDYYPINIDVLPEVENMGDDEISIWEMKNIPKFEKEEYMPPENDYRMKILFKPLKFNLEDYYGSSNDWKNYGMFYNLLTDGRYELPEKAKQEIESLTKNVNNKKELVEILYKYLQNKNRYVDIEMGINGWQPQKAKDVYFNRYGDCKDLSTYMISILRHSGIEAYPALALSRNRGKLVDEFPMSQFNHCITMAIVETDTIWLECTASYTDLDDTPYNIENITALVVNNEGGVLVKTPQKSAVKNMAKSIISANLMSNGTLKYSADINLTGNQKNYFKYILSSRNEKEDKEFVQGILNDYYPNVYVDNYTVCNTDESKLEYGLGINGEYKKFIPTAGKRIFINPAIYNRKLLSALPKEKPEERKFPVYYLYPFVDLDSVNISLPEGFNLESIPKSISIENNFAKYNSKYLFENDTIKYSRYYEIKRNLIPVENYEEYLEFLKLVIKTDKAKFVLKRK